MEYLREKPVVSGYYIDFISPSATSADYTWPDGFAETIRVTDHPHEATRKAYKLKIFRRGSAEGDEMRETLDAHEQRLADLRADMEAKSNAELAREIAEVEAEEAAPAATEPRVSDARITQESEPETTTETTDSTSAPVATVTVPEPETTTEATGANATDTVPAGDILPKECAKDGPHFHCEVCFEEDGAPKCFKSGGGREGHKRSEGHKANVPVAA